MLPTLVALTPWTRHLLRLRLLFVCDGPAVNRFPCNRVWQLLNEHFEPKPGLLIHVNAEMGKFHAISSQILGVRKGMTLQFVVLIHGRN